MLAEMLETPKSYTWKELSLAAYDYFIGVNLVPSWQDSSLVRHNWNAESAILLLHMAQLIWAVVPYIQEFSKVHAFGV